MLSRKGYWARVLMAGIVLLTLLPVFVFIMGSLGTALAWSTSTAVGLLWLKWSMARLHDAGLSGTWLWLAVVPLVGTVGVILLLCVPSDTFNFFAPPNSVY